MFENIDLHVEKVKEIFGNFDLFKKAFIDYYVNPRCNLADYKLYDSKLKCFPNAVVYVMFVESKDLKNAALFLEDFDAFVASSPEYKALSALHFELDGIKRFKVKRSGEKVYRLKLSCILYFESHDFSKYSELLRRITSSSRSSTSVPAPEGGEG